MSNLKLGVFSGKCLLGITGTKTSLKDWDGAHLCVGDIVAISPKNGDLLNHFTVVADDKFTTYSDGKIIQDIKGVPFVMGLKDAEMNNWTVMKIKDHSDCIDGEHWKAFGIYYKMIDLDEVEGLWKIHGLGGV